MRTWYSWFALAALALVSASAAAADPFNLDGLRALIDERNAHLEARQADPVVGQVVAPGGQVLAVYGVGLPDLVSAPGQSVRELLRRGEPMRNRTRETGWEVCARICVSAAGRYGLRPTTIRASLVCATSASICPQGFRPTDQSVHTHGAGPIIVPTAIDLELDPAATLTPVQPNELSPEDKAVPGTWLLAPNGAIVN